MYRDRRVETVPRSAASVCVAKKDMLDYDWTSVAVRGQSGDLVFCRWN